MIWTRAAAFLLYSSASGASKGTQGVFADLVLKNETTNRNADALSERAEERKQGYGEGNVGSIVTSLDGESETSEEEAETDAVDEVN